MKQAKTHMNALLKPKLPTCIKYSLFKSVGGTNIDPAPVKARKLGKFAETSVSYRAPIVVKSGGQDVAVLSDFVFLRKGRTEIYINVVAPSSAEKQLNAFETRLARTLVKRVRG